MNPLESICANNNYNSLPQTIEQKLEEGIEDYDAGHLYIEEEIWSMMFLNEGENKIIFFRVIQ